MAKLQAHICEFYQWTPSAIQYMSYNDQTNELAIAREDNSIQIWQVTDNVCWQVKKIAASEDRSIEALIWCKGEVISAGLTGEILIYDTLALDVRKTVTASSSAIWCMKSNYDGDAIALGTEDGSIIIYTINKLDAKDKIDVIFEKIISHENHRIICLAWGKNDKYLVTGSLGVAKVWDFKTGTVINRLPFPSTKNGETVVWCIDMFGGKTVVCGDSTGTVSFWSAKHGTLAQEHKRHHADILCMFVNEETNKIYCSGIDPFVIIYELVKTDRDTKSWVQSNHRNLHTHDVRAICSTPHYLLTGGVDCNLMMSKYPPKTRITIPDIPLHSVYVPLKSSRVLLKYTSHVELWQLGVADKKDEAGEQLSIVQPPEKVFEIRSKHDEAIVSAACSPNCDWLVYSTPTLLRLYHLITDSESKPIVHKVPCDFGPGFTVQVLTWLGNSDQFIVATTEQTLHVLKADPVHADLIHTFHPRDSSSTFAVIYTLISSDSGEKVAAADEKGNVYIYNVARKKFHCQLPQYQYPATAMCFDTDSRLIIAYADNKLLEFNISKRTPTEFSLVLGSLAQDEKWFPVFNTIVTVTCNKEMIMFQSTKLMVLLNKKEKQPHIKTCTDYKYIIYGGLGHGENLIIVQRTPNDLLSILPPALKVKKFGN